MTTIVTRLLAVMLGLFVAAHVVDGIEVDGLYTAFIVALVLGFLNIVLRPILVVLTLPITVLSFGLFLFVLNALLFWFVGSFVDGFDVRGFGSALLGSLIVSSISWLAHKLR